MSLWLKFALRRWCELRQNCTRRRSVSQGIASPEQHQLLLKYHPEPKPKASATENYFPGDNAFPILERYSIQNQPVNRSENGKIICPSVSAITEKIVLRQCDRFCFILVLLCSRTVELRFIVICTYKRNDIIIKKS